MSGGKISFIWERDRSNTPDAEVDTSYAVICRIAGFEFDFVGEVRFTYILVPDESNVLRRVNFREVSVRSSLVFPEQETRPILHEAQPLAESDAVVFGVAFESVFYDRDRTLGACVAVFVVVGRIRLVCVVN